MEESKRIGRYQVLGRVASRHLTDVYCARLEGIAGFRRLFAIRQLHDGLTSRKEVVDAVEGEARRAAKLAHGNILQLIDMGRTDADALYLVTEWVEGWTLSEAIAKAKIDDAPMPIVHTAWLAVQLLKALEYAHQHRQFHDAICTTNIQLGRGGEVKIADFGLGKAVRSIGWSHPSLIAGELPVIAPERTAKNSPSAAADIWGVAAVVYEIIVGEPPGSAEGAPPAMRPDVPEAFFRVVMQALSVDPSARPASAVAFKSAIMEALAGKTEFFSQDQLGTWLADRLGQPEALPGSAPSLQADVVLPDFSDDLDLSSSHVSEPPPSDDLAIDDEYDIKTAIGGAGVRITTRREGTEPSISRSSSKADAKISPAPDVPPSPPVVIDAPRFQAFPAQPSQGYGGGALVACLVLGLVVGFVLAGQISTARTVSHASLDVHVVGEAVDVAIDGKRVHPPVSLPPGAHRVQVSVPNRPDYQTVTDIPAGACKLLLIERAGVAE